MIHYPGNLVKKKEFSQFLWAHKPDVIVHCAAKVGGVNANRLRPISFLSDNLDIQGAVINAAGEMKIPKLVFIGSSCMFPTDALLPVKEESLLTGKLNDSVEAYAIAKIAGWRLCKAWREEAGLDYITVCPSNIYGPGDKYNEDSHVIPALIRRAAAAQGSLEVWGDGSAVREFIYCDDVARAIDVAIEKWSSPEPLNIGTGISTTIKEAVDLIIQEVKPGLSVKWLTDMPQGVPRKTFDISTLSSLGWTPQISLGDGLKLAVSDFLKRFPSFSS